MANERDRLVILYQDLCERHGGMDTAKADAPEVYKTMQELLTRIRAHDDGVCHE